MEKTANRMIYEITPDGDVVVVDLSSSDYVISGFTPKGIIIGDGTKVYVDITNSDKTVVQNVVYTGPGMYGIQNGVSKIHKTGVGSTDATLVWLVKKVPS
jgi:hypothetical protein